MQREMPVQVMITCIPMEVKWLWWTTWPGMPHRIPTFKDQRFLLSPIHTLLWQICSRWKERRLHTFKIWKNKWLTRLNNSASWRRSSLKRTTKETYGLSFPILQLQLKLRRIWTRSSLMGEKYFATLLRKKLGTRECQSDCLSFDLFKYVTVLLIWFDCL